MSKKGVSLFPFPGIRYNIKNSDLSLCVAPPYDVFEYGDSMDINLRNISNNIVHIQKPVSQNLKTNKGEDFNDKYLEANRIFKNWEKNQILVKDETSYYYLYEQETETGIRRGIIAACEIDDTYEFIRRHEKIKSGPKIDRLKLTLATGLNIGLIFTIMKDADNTFYNHLNHLATTNKPVIEFDWPPQPKNSAESNILNRKIPMNLNIKKIKNRLFCIKDKFLEDLLKERILYIADGHHRYQTMVEYRNLMRYRFRHTNNNKNDFEKTMLFVAPDKNLVVLGYHRLIKNLPANILNNFIEKISTEFKIIKRSINTIFAPEKKGQFGIYMQGKGFIVEINSEYLSKDSKNSLEYNIDTAILQERIFEEILGLDEDKIKAGSFITYPNSEDKIEKIKELVDNGSHLVAFLLFPASARELIRIADEKKVMPQKSTYFHPKLLTGLVLNKVAPPSLKLNVTEF